MAKMTTLELEGLLGKLQQTATGQFSTTVNHERAELMKRYLAKHYGDEVEDRSQIVDTTVRDVIESIKPELMDIFMGGDRVVEFVPRGAEDIEAAKQEMDVCNHVFMQQNDGFMILYSWFMDALFQKNGYIKRYWDERKRTEISEYDDLDPQEAAQLLEELEETSDEIEIVERSGGVDEETGEVSPLYLKIKRTDTDKRYTIVNVPPEEVIVHPQWTRVDLVGCPFVAHKRPVIISDLVEMGFNRKEVEDLGTYERQIENEETAVRHDHEDWTIGNIGSEEGATREVLVYENYVLVDRDDDGIAEQLQIFTDENGKILKRNGKLAIEHVTDAPFECLTPIPIPHRHYGLSIAEVVDDLQRLKTVLTRQLADNTIGSNNPDWIADEDQMTESTAQDLSQTGFSRVIRIPGGAGALTPVKMPDTAAASLAAIEYVDNLKEARTGITRYNQGTDANSLNKTASGIQQIMSAAQKKVLMIARVFAETGVKSLFVNMHRDLRAGPVKEIAFKLNNEWVPVNPRTWKGRTDITVSVGLGTGDRDMQVARLTQIVAEQKEGFASGLVQYEHLYHSYSKILELSGFKDVENFFPDPEAVMQMMQQRAEQPEQPDPATMIAQIEMQKAQLDAQKMQFEAQTKQAELELKRMEIQNKRLEMLMKDDRERDLKAADIEADEAARMERAVNGQELTQRG